MGRGRIIAIAASHVCCMMTVARGTVGTAYKIIIIIIVVVVVVLVVVIIIIIIIM